jgi:hypothetical protein
MKAASAPATSGDLGCHKFNAMGPKRPQKQVKQIHTSGEIATEKLAPKSGVSIHIAKKKMRNRHRRIQWLGASWISSQPASLGVDLLPHSTPNKYT